MKFLTTPLLASDGIPAAALKARQDALDQIYQLCRDVYTATDDNSEEVERAINEMPALCKIVQRPLMPKGKRSSKPKLRIRKATA